MKKSYVEPELEIIEAEDIVTYSTEILPSED